MRSDLTIIVGESNEGHFLLTKKSFHRWGLNHPVIRFADTQKIFDFLNASKISNSLDTKKYVLICSINIPHNDDFDVLLAIRKDDELKKIPIVVLSTLSDRTIIKQCQDIGCRAFFVKPLQKEVFLQVMTDIGADISVPKSSQDGI